MNVTLINSAKMQRLWSYLGIKTQNYVNHSRIIGGKMQIKILPYFEEKSLSCIPNIFGNNTKFSLFDDKTNDKLYSKICLIKMERR